MNEDTPDRYICETCNKRFKPSEAIEKTILGKRMSIVEQTCPNCGRQLLTILKDEVKSSII